MKSKFNLEYNKIMNLINEGVDSGSELAEILINHLPAKGKYATPEEKTKIQEIADNAIEERNTELDPMIGKFATYATLYDIFGNGHYMKDIEFVVSVKSKNENGEYVIQPRDGFDDRSEVLSPIYLTEAGYDMIWKGEDSFKTIYNANKQREKDAVAQEKEQHAAFKQTPEYQEFLNKAKSEYNALDAVGYGVQLKRPTIGKTYSDFFNFFKQQPKAIREAFIDDVNRKKVTQSYDPMYENWGQIGGDNNQRIDAKNAYIRYLEKLSEKAGN